MLQIDSLEKEDFDEDEAEDRVKSDARYHQTGLVTVHDALLMKPRVRGRETHKTVPEPPPRRNPGRCVTMAGIGGNEQGFSGRRKTKGLEL